MLGELERQVLVVGVVGSELHGDLEHVLREQRHPCGAVGLLQMTPGRQLRAAVEDADVVETEEAALEHVLAEAVLAIHPPREVQQELGEGVTEEFHVSLAALRLLGAVEEQGGEGVHRRVHVTEVPLVGGDLPVRVQVVPAQHQLQLLLGEVEVHDPDRQGMEGEVPGRVPGILPLVGHGDDVVVDHVEPLAVPELAAAVMKRVSAVLFQPRIAVEGVILLGPQHAGDRLAHHVGLIRRNGWRRHRLVELVRLLKARGQDVVEGLSEGARPGRRLGGQAQPHRRRLAGADPQLVVRRRLGALLRGVHRLLPHVDHVVVDAVLEVRASVQIVEVEPGVVGLVLGHEQRDVAFAEQMIRPQDGMLCRERARARRSLDFPQDRLRGGVRQP